MKYSDRNTKDKKILIGISSLSLSERYKRIRDLEQALKKAEADFERKQKETPLNKKHETQLLADQDGIIELRYRISLERSEYLAQKQITPDYIE